jgi:hypothetical protein
MSTIPSKKTAQDLIAKINKALEQIKESTAEHAAASAALVRYQEKVAQLQSGPMTEPNLEALALAQTKITALAPLIEAAELRAEGPATSLIDLLREILPLCGAIVSAAAEKRIEEITAALAPFYKAGDGALIAARQTDEYRSLMGVSLQFTQATVSSGFLRNTELNLSLANRAIALLREYTSATPEFAKFGWFKNSHAQEHVEPATAA